MEVNEALSIQQRIKRANIAHRNANKLKVSRDRAARKLAPEGNIKKRAYAVARKILRKRIAGGRGAVYQELGPTEKISIDKQLDKKKAIIKKIAMRLIPKIRQSEQHRLQSFLKGKAMKNDINEAFEKKFKKKKGKPDSYIKFFNKFTEEKQNNSGAYRSLLKKSEKYGVDVNEIGEIYSEAFNDYDADATNLTAEQFAFTRVNRALNELSKKTMWSYAMSAKGDNEWERGKSGTPRNKHTAKNLTPDQIKTHNKRGKGLNYVAHKLTGAPKYGKSFSKANNLYQEDLDESNNTPYVKKHIENGEHKGWKASNKHGKVKYFGLPFQSSANKHAGLNEGVKETAYSQQELGKHVKTYKNVSGSKFDLYKNLNGHKLVQRISGKSEDFDGHHDTRALHKRLLKTMLPEETQLDEVSPSRASMGYSLKTAQHNLANLKKGIKPEPVKKALTWKQHMKNLDGERRAGYKEHKKHYEYHKAELADLHKTYKDLHSGNLGIHKDDKEGQHGAEEEIESMKDKHRAKLTHHLNQMHYHNSQLDKPYKIREEVENLDELSMRTMGSYNEKARDQLKAHASAAADRLANKVRDPKAAREGAATTLKRYQGLNRLKRKFTEETSIEEGRFIVSGTHEDQGFSKTKVYKADSEQHARDQFHSEFDKFNAKKIKKLSLGKLKNEEVENLDEISADKLHAYRSAALEHEWNYKDKKAIKYRKLADKKLTGRAHVNANPYMSTPKPFLNKEEHTNCGTPECCGQCEPLDEFVVTAAAIAGVAAMRKAKKVAPKVGNHIKNQTFTQAGHLKDKVASIIAKKEEKPETRMSSKEYLKKREAMVKEETDLTNRIDNLKENSGKYKLSKFVYKTGKYEPHSEHESADKAREAGRKLLAGGHGNQIRIHKPNGEKLPLNKKSYYSENVNEVLGPENQIGTKALVKKLQNLTPGQEKAQVNEQYEKELIHHGVILHKTNKERKTERGGYSTDHKVIKWSKEYEINPNLKSFSGKGAGHAHQFAHQKAVRDHPEVKKHLKDGWAVDSFKIDPSKKPVLDHINTKLAYIKKQNGNLHLAEELDLDEACWKGYKQLGMKKKGKRTVPNCVKEDVKSAQVKGVIVPAYVDANGNTIPAKTVKRKEGNKILRTGNMQDGK